ncbi:MAG TPA: DEAD/DEAH box helicase [Candidatus Gastranaerophilaceae bacterium]|nr:DEAD/DEAH box helicase [Candidatus Gastranaerophilaceae bacterium]
MSSDEFNYRYIKDKATPGSWRRGYEYHLKDQVLEGYPEKNFYKGKVKGNFQDFYKTDLIFKKGGVEARCNCPLKEEWCKHAVAVGLKAIDEHAFEDFLETKYGIESSFEDENTALTEPPKGNYIFHFNPKRKPNFFSILVMSRETGKVVRSIEQILKGLIEAQKQDKNFELNTSQMVEVAIFKQLLKTSRQDKKAGWYDIQLTKFADMFPLLAKADEVLDEKSKQRLKFTDKEWRLALSVNYSQAGNIMLALEWKRPDKDDVYPFEEIRYFSRHLKWGRYKNVIFPINIEVGAIPQYLVKSSFTDLKDSDGGKFIYEEMPGLQKIMDVEVSEEINKLMLEQKPPLNIVTMGIDYDQSLKASLEFEYDGIRVPFSKTSEKTPYVTVKKPKEDSQYWIKRNLKHEQDAYNMLLACKFVPMQTNNLALEKENAVDFYNYYIKQAGEGWKFEEKDDLGFFKLAEDSFKLRAEVDFCEESKDSFQIYLYGQVGEDKISFDDVYNTIQSGEKYARVRSLGFVEYPAQDIYAMMRSFNSFDVYRNNEDKFLVKTYRAGLLNELENFGVELDLSEDFSNFWDQISSFSTKEDIEIPKDVKAELREYQAKGFSWLWFMYKYGLNGILADDMGLGKTLQALTLLQRAKENDGPMPTLVICPTSVVFNWELEIQKFVPGLTCLKLAGIERKELFKDIPKYDIVITSYALVRRDIEKLKKINFRYVILDESQNIKNALSQTAQSVKRLVCDHKLALSGTPIENRLEELWSVFDFLMPGFLFSISEFNYRYVNPIMERADKTVEKRLKLQIYPFILRRMKRDVAKDLPDKVENIAYCELTDEQRDFYLEVLDSTKEELFKSIEQNGLEKSRMSIFSALLRLRQICCHPRLYDKENIKKINESGKFEHLKEMLEEIISEKHRVLLFSQFVDMLELIREWLDKEGIRYEYLTGQTKDRQGAVERFNNSEDIPIFLVSLKAGGTGLNLTGADYVIHYDPWWNPAVEDQATDRAYRIGQKKKVFVYRLITKNTVEEKIQKLKQVKRNLVDSVISVDRNITKSLTMDDVREIFSVD